jgi:hypothetical protein
MAGSRRIELDEPLDQETGAVEVVVRFQEPVTSSQESVFDLIARLNGGGRSKEDIDAQLQAERAAWGDR